MAQLSLSMAAIHTTGDMITQVIYDLCEHPELIRPLREEAIAVFGNSGWKRASLYNLKLMDKYHLLCLLYTSLRYYSIHAPNCYGRCHP